VPVGQSFYLTKRVVNGHRTAKIPDVNSILIQCFAECKYQLFKRVGLKMGSDPLEPTIGDWNFRPAFAWSSGFGVIVDLCKVEF
jgi:hypothetical protein